MNPGPIPKSPTYKASGKPQVKRPSLPVVIVAFERRRRFYLLKKGRILPLFPLPAHWHYHLPLKEFG